MIADIHKARTDIHRVIGSIQKLQGKMASEGGDRGARELALTITKLQEARHWLGETLGAVGVDLPAGYPKDEAD